MNDRQMAGFSINQYLVRDNPDAVAQVFALLRAVVVRAESRFDKRTIDYIAISDRFAEVKEGERLPEVTLQVKKDSLGNVVAVDIGH